MYLTDTQVEQSCATLRKAIEAAENSNHDGEVFVVAAANALKLLDACKALDAFWIADWKPPHVDPEQEGERLLTKETMNVWRNIRAAIALAEGRSA